jgi:hypothetical protein
MAPVSRILCIALVFLGCLGATACSGAGPRDASQSAQVPRGTDDLATSIPAGAFRFVPQIGMPGAIWGVDLSLVSAFVAELSRSLRHRAKRLLGLGSVADAHTGAVAAIH